MQIKLFVRDHCPECPAAFDAVDGLDGVEVYGLADAEGIAAAASYGVIVSPTVLVVSTDGVEVAGWRGVAPDRSTVRAHVAQ
jgi:hypothetical protein